LIFDVGVGSEAMKYNPLFGEICDLDRPVKLVEEPYNTYVSAGKNTYVYDTHTYHTKVPPEGIELFIKYYTDENDVVLDPFCGSGMTGVAALRQNRKVLLSDLSPAATFIAENLSSPIDANVYMDAVHTLLRKSSDLEKQLYSTTCRECGKRVSTIYTVWSYGAICNHCSTEFTIWDVARDERDTVKESKILSEFDCPHCGIRIKKRELKRTDLYPVALGYKCCTKSLKEKVHNILFLRTYGIPPIRFPKASTQNSQFQLVLIVSTKLISHALYTLIPFCGMKLSLGLMWK